MTILNGYYSQEPESGDLIAALQRNIEAIKPALDDERGDAIALLGEGLALSDVLDFKNEHREALFQLGCRFVLGSDLEQAHNTFMMLSLLDPLEERASYGLGVVEQMRGNLQKAAQFFLQFVLLDATNPKGYLRLGECLLGAKEYEEARSALLTAKKLAENGRGSPAEAAEATRLLTHILDCHN